MAGVADEPPGQLTGVQETLFIPLVARARDSSRKRPLLRDPKAAEMVRSTGLDTARYSRGAGGAFFVMRTAILDTWVRAFLAGHPGAGPHRRAVPRRPRRAGHLYPADTASSRPGPTTEPRQASPMIWFTARLHARSRRAHSMPVSRAAVTRSQSVAVSRTLGSGSLSRASRMTLA